MSGRLRKFLRLPQRSSARRRADLDDELRFYFDMRTRELVEQGLPEDDGEARGTCASSATWITQNDIAWRRTP